MQGVVLAFGSFSSLPATVRTPRDGCPRSAFGGSRRRRPSSSEREGVVCSAIPRRPKGAREPRRAAPGPHRRKIQRHARSLSSMTERHVRRRPPRQGSEHARSTSDPFIHRRAVRRRGPPPRSMPRRPGTSENANANELRPWPRVMKSAPMDGLSRLAADHRERTGALTPERKQRRARRPVCPSRSVCRLSPT